MVKAKEELSNEKVYYLYFKEAVERTSSPSQGDNDTKRVILATPIQFAYPIRNPIINIVHHSLIRMQVSVLAQTSVYRLESNSP